MFKAIDTKVDEILTSINNKQRKLFLILVPIAFFIITFGMIKWTYPNASFSEFKWGLGYVWWLWLTYLLIVGYLEFKILGKLK